MPNIFNEFKINESYIFEIDNDVNELNDLFKKNKKGDKINEITNKIKSCEKGYNKRNSNKMDEDKDVIMSFVYFYPDKEFKNIDIKYSHSFNYELNIKMKGLNYEASLHFVKSLLELSKENRKSFMLIDKRMEAYVDKNKEIYNGNYIIYFLKIKTKSELIELFNKGKFITLNKATMAILQPYYNKIKSTDDVNEICRNIDIIINIFRRRIILSGVEKWLKSIGEFWALVSFILLFNNNILINTENIQNPQTNRKLEIDFYVNEHYLALEIDGKHHTADKQQINDKIKNIICEKENITLYRVDWNNKFEDFLFSEANGLYFKLSDFLKSKNADNVIELDKYKNICCGLRDNINFCSFDYKFKKEYKFDCVCDADENTKNMGNKTMLIHLEGEKLYSEIKKYDDENEKKFEKKIAAERNKTKDKTKDKTKGNTKGNTKDKKKIIVKGNKRKNQS